LSKESEDTSRSHLPRQKAIAGRNQWAHSSWQSN